MNHSQKFDKVKKYYESGFWTLIMVRNSVEKQWITEEEYKEITGEEYPEPNINNL